MCACADIEDPDLCQPDSIFDEYHPKATRSLFIGGLELRVTKHDVYNVCQRFGIVLDVDIKYPSAGAAAAAAAAQSGAVACVAPSTPTTPTGPKDRIAAVAPGDHDDPEWSQTCYAFVQYTDVYSVVRAMRYLTDSGISEQKVKVRLLLLPSDLLALFWICATFLFFKNRNRTTQNRRKRVSDFFDFLAKFSGF